MNDWSEKYEIARLIAAEMTQTITPEEKHYLDGWLKDDRHAEVYRQIRVRLEQGEGKHPFKNRIDVKSDWDKVRGHLPKERKRLSDGFYYRYAAIAVLLLSMAGGWLWWQWRERGNDPVPLAVETQQTAKEKKVILTLANGTQVDLEELQEKSVREGSILARKGEEGLVYEKESVGETKSENVLHYHTIDVPRGGEYRLTLADGTRVWLNSDTELKYPTDFVGNTRKVFLQGEAYFEVAANKSMPFIVETANVNINVLGTGFNVTAYSEEEENRVTLVHGKVGVDAAGKQIILQPEEQYIYNVETQQGKVQKVDVSHYVDWKNGILYFDALPLEELTVKLSRWYDVDFFFTSENLKRLKFSGAFNKTDNIAYVLSIIEEVAGVRFVINGKTIVVNRV